MDISKCSGEGCPIKDRCYRYTSKAGTRQFYIQPPFKIEDGKFTCEMYWGEGQQGILEQLEKIVK